MYTHHFNAETSEKCFEEGRILTEIIAKHVDDDHRSDTHIVDKYTIQDGKHIHAYAHPKTPQHVHASTQTHTHMRAHIPGKSRPVGEMPLFVEGEAVPLNLLSCMQAGFSSSDGDKPPEEW